MVTVEIDDAMYEYLGQHVKGFETPNDVLRRLLLGEEKATGGSGMPKNVQGEGSLAELIRRGLVAPGDELRHTKVRSGRTYTAEVMEGGFIRSEKGTYGKPSPALADLVGSQINGWTAWVHVASGKALHTLHEEL